MSKILARGGEGNKAIKSERKNNNNNNNNKITNSLYPTLKCIISFKLYIVQ